MLNNKEMERLGRLHQAFSKMNKRSIDKQSTNYLEYVALAKKYAIPVPGYKDYAFEPTYCILVSYVKDKDGDVVRGWRNEDGVYGHNLWAHHKKTFYTPRELVMKVQQPSEPTLNRRAAAKITEDMDNQIDDFAMSHNLSRSDVIRLALKYFLQEVVNNL